MTDQVAFIVTLTAKEGRFEEMKEHLFHVVEQMSFEDAFINTWVHQTQDDPNTIMLYETWACSKEQFLSEHLSRPYRLAYEKILPDLLATERTLRFLDIIKSHPSKSVA